MEENKQIENKNWENEFDAKWRILRPLYELPVDQKLAFDQHDRKLAEIKEFIKNLLTTKDLAWQKKIEEAIKEYETDDSMLDKPHTDERYDQDAKNEMARGLRSLLLPPITK